LPESSGNADTRLAELAGGLLSTAYSYSEWRPWLSQCADFLACENVALVRWNPEVETHQVAYSSSGAIRGNASIIPDEWCEWFNELMSFYLPEGPELLEDIMVSLDQARGFECGYDLEGLISLAPKLNDNVRLCLIWWQDDYVLFVARRAENIPWSQFDASNLRFLTQHVHQALKINRHIYEQRLGNAIAASVLNTAPRGMAITDAQGRIGFCTSRARHILDKNDGIALENGLLKFACPEQQQEFEQAAEVLQKAGKGTLTLSIQRPSGKTSLQFMLVSLKTMSSSRTFLEERPFLSVYLHDPSEQAELSLQQLQRYFSFTKAEAKVAISLFKNDNLQTAAEEVGISVNTARTHLRRIYKKADVTGQAELMRALSGGLRAELVSDLSAITPDFSVFTTARKQTGVRKV